MVCYLICDFSYNFHIDAIKSVKRLHIADDMDHGSFDFFSDLIMPLMNFMEELRARSSMTTMTTTTIRKRSRVFPRNCFRDSPVIEIASLK